MGIAWIEISQRHAFADSKLHSGSIASFELQIINKDGILN